jgi:hypothetical protein
MRKQYARSKQMNSNIAASLYESVSIVIDRFHTHIVCKSKVQLLGFADVSLEVPSVPGFALKLRGIEVKVLNGKPRIDTPSERSKGAGDAQFYPIYFPKSAEMRAVLTARIFETQEVSNAVATAEQQRTQGATPTQTGSNPFAGNAQPVSNDAPPTSNSDATEVAKHLKAAGFTDEQVERAVAEL